MIKPYVKPFILALSAALLMGAVSGPKLVDANKITSTSVMNQGKSVAIFCLGSVPGSAKVQGSKFKFTSFAYLLSRTSPTRSRSSYNKWRALSRSGKTACKNGPAIPNPIPTPTPAPVGNFDTNGNVTEAGKLLFGIPANLSANLSLGRDVQNAMCSGCHIERTNYTFTAVREGTSQSPMLFDEIQLPDDKLANLIAYLNRFRQ